MMKFSSRGAGALTCTIDPPMETVSTLLEGCCAYCTGKAGAQDVAVAGPPAIITSATARTPGVSGLLVMMVPP